MARLDVPSYVEGAREGGGQLLYDENGQATGTRQPLDDATIDQDRMILGNFAGWVAGYNQSHDRQFDPATPDGLSALITAWPDSLRARGLKVATIERYMVTMRRYARHRGFEEGQFKGLTPRNSRPRGPAKLIEVTQLESWLEQIADQNELVLLATWLLLSRVPVGKLPELTFDLNVKRSRGRVTVELDDRKLDLASWPAGLLADRWKKGAPVLAVEIDDEFALRIGDDAKAGDLVAVPPYLLRRRWEALQGKGAGRGPAMREILAFGRLYEVDQVDGQLNISGRMLLASAG